MGWARGRWTFGVLASLCWAYVMVPRLVQSATAPKFRFSVGGEQTSLTPLAQLLQLALLLAVVGLCAAVVLAHLRSIPTRRSGVLVLTGALFTYGILRDLAAGSSPSANDLLFPAVVLAVWLLRPGLQELAALGWLLIASAALNAAVGALLPGGLFRHQDGGLIAPEKQILPGGILVGVFTQGNVLGQLLSLGLPALALLQRRWRLPGAVLVVGVVLWSASRSSLLAIAAAGAVFLLLRWGGPLWRRTTAAAVLGGLVCVTVGLPLSTTDPTAFSNRGYIWSVSLRVWREHPLFGWGSGYYTSIGQYVNPLGPTAWHGHNTFVHVLVTGGLVELALLAALFGMLLHRCVSAATAGWAWPTAQVAALLVSCALEVSFGVVDRQFLLTSVLIPLVVVLVSRAPDDRSQPGGPEPAPGQTLAGSVLVSAR